MSGLIRNACGECEECCGPDDHHQYCTRLEGILGMVTDGAFADYHVVDSRTTCHIPPGISLTDAAALACAGRTVYRAIIKSNVPSGQFLGLVGAGGGLGHLGLQFALANGVKVIAIDARDEALQLCKDLGAQYVLDARLGQEAVVSEVMELTEGRGVEATVNVSAHSTSTGLSCAITKLHGTVVQTAAPEEVSASPFELIFRDIRLIGTMLAGREVSQEMLEQYAKHSLTVQKEIFYGLDKVPLMAERLHSGKVKGKAVCVVNKELLDLDKLEKPNTKSLL